MNSDANRTILPSKALIKNLAKSLRSQVVVLAWVIYSVVVTANVGFRPLIILLGLVLFIATYGVVAIQNDIFDVQIDKINNRKDIPYANGLVTEKNLFQLMLGLSIVIVLVGWAINYSVLPWIGLYLLLGWMYSGPLNVQGRGIFAALLLGFCYGAVPWIVGASAVNAPITFELVCIICLSFIFKSGVIVIKDFKDKHGDKIGGKKTLLVKHGAEATRKYYVFLTTLAFVVMIFVNYIQGEYLLMVLGSIGAVLNFLLLRSRVIFSNSEKRKKRSSLSRLVFILYALTVYVM